MSHIKKIIIIRRDNIGDLLCTTPAIRALREKFPDAQIDILVNSYNKAIIENNPDINNVLVYRKTKHEPYRNKLSIWLEVLRLYLKIWMGKYDVAIGASSHYIPRVGRFTFFTGARRRIGYISQKGLLPRLFYNCPVKSPERSVHEVKVIFDLLHPLGIKSHPGNLILNISDVEKNGIETFLKTNGIKRDEPLIGIHISSRKKQNRWSPDKFIQLIDFLMTAWKVAVLLLWMPGDEDNPYHPGDDKKAFYIAEKTIRRPLCYRTTSLKELIASISVCRMLICGDGGAMHIAAAFGIPVVTIWGITDERRWAPWITEHIILKGKENADDISVEEVIEAVRKFSKSPTKPIFPCSM
ncbi:MAG: glycosyltransferase family 9 protein [Nitrospirota bacterium]